LKLLEVAAYFGARFDVRDIAEFLAMAVEDVESLLWEPLHQGIVYLQPLHTVNPACVRASFLRACVRALNVVEP
jgi:hypothetical protein